MMNKKRKESIYKTIIAFMIVLLFSGGCVSDKTKAGSQSTQPPDMDQMTEKHEIVENMSLYVDDKAPAVVKTLHYEYRNNRFVSMRDFAAALSGSEKSFQVTIDKDQASIVTGKDYEPAGGEGEPFDDSYLSPYDDVVFRTFPLDLNPVEIDGRPLHYRTFLGCNTEGQPDCFISLTDLVMQLDVKVKMSDKDIYLNSQKRYSADPDELLDKEFYYETHSALLGDASTGKVLIPYNIDDSVAIASTSKLMTYLVLMDKVSEGQITLDDQVEITEDSAYLSRTTDGEIVMNAGEEASFMDLVTGMLVPSSDECALALAIYAAGSEAEFVDWMNQKASELGLSEDAIFLNCHGLPEYTDDLPASKIQNRMSARDMFTLVCRILDKYPEILDITSKQTAYLKSFDKTVENTNPLLYNVPGVKGLKTGTTNMAGDCVVAVMDVKDSSGNSHYVTVVQFGAEDETIRATLAEELIRYGKRITEKYVVPIAEQ